MSRRRGIGVTAVVVGAVLLGLGWGSLAAAKSKAPAVPTIDQVVGVWTGTASRAEYDLTTGKEQSTSVNGTYTVTKLGAQTVNIHFAGGGETWDNSAYYGGGVMCTGSAIAYSLSSWAKVNYIMITSKGGKLSGEGQSINYDMDDGYSAISTITIKHK